MPLLSPAERHIVEVRRESDGAHMPGSPLSLEPETAFTEEFRGFAEALKRQKGGLYSDIEARILMDRDATRANVLDALEWLDTAVTSRDIASC